MEGLRVEPPALLDIVPALEDRRDDDEFLEEGEDLGREFEVDRVVRVA